MKKSRGFTVVELVLVIALLALAGTVFYFQKQTAEDQAADRERKTAINAIDYALREVYHPAKGSYPRTIDEKTFSVIEPGLLKDPSGRAIGDPASDYRYEPSQCEGDACQGYELRADLKREADYVKTSQN